MKRRRYETIDHTADRAVWIHGRTDAEMYENAAFALADLVCDADRIEPHVERNVDVAAGDLGETVVRLMNELLYLADAEGLVLPLLTIEDATPTRVVGRARGDRLDPDRHGFKGALKAATYHDLRIERTVTGVRLRVVLDV